MPARLGIPGDACDPSVYLVELPLPKSRGCRGGDHICGSTEQREDPVYLWLKACCLWTSKVDENFASEIVQLLLEALWLRGNLQRRARRSPPRIPPLHSIIKASAPSLSPKVWYGMPAYAKDGKVVCFFRGVIFSETERYMTFGFTEESNLDEGHLWPTAFALKELTAAEEAKIGALVKKAVS
jgi:hypothetical protein